MTKMTATEKTLEKFNFLPPKVCGRTRGYFDLVFEDIRWKTSKSFIGIEAKIQFWGQTKATSEKFTTNISKHKTGGNLLGSVRYHILTNFTLFQAYLNNSEPLEIEIYSSKTLTLIGSSKIDLSKVLTSNQELQDYASLRLASQILNQRQFNLGELIVSINIQYFKPIKMTKSIQSIETLPVKKVFVEKENKENIEVVGKAKRISFKDPAPPKPSTLCKKSVKSVFECKVIRSIATQLLPSIESKIPISPVNLHQVKKDSILSYLSGDPLSKADESSILKDIVSISPAHSFIEALDKIKPLPREENLLSKIDSIKISLSGIEFTSAGILELQESSKYHKKSLIKCVVTSKLFITKEDVKMNSPVFEVFPKRISFNKSVVQKVQIPQQKQEFKKNYINFGFCHRSIEQLSPPFFIGFVRVNIADVMNSKFSFHKKCRIISESEMVVGSIDVKLELGVGGLHFGKHLLDSFETFRENISVYSDESIYELNQGLICNQNFQPTCRPSHNENNCETNGQRYESKNTQTEKKTNEVNHVNEHIGSNEDAEMVDVEKAGKQFKSKIYHGLLYIDDLRNVKNETSVEYFINYEGFWNECQESTEESVDLSFNYLKQFPVICDDSFLKRVQNNHMELKLWEKNGNNTEKWIGSAKIPLHQFFIAFRDIAMIEHLSTNKLPIISIDSWTNFISPLSMEQFCQCKIMLAIGSEHQIDYLRMSRNIPKVVSLPSTSASCAANAEATNEIKNKLTAFIESLTQKMPAEKLVPTVEPVKIIEPKESTEAQRDVRKTSDLLESLQNALSKVPPPPSEPTQTTTKIMDIVDCDTSISSISSEMFKILIQVEQAIHLPKVIKKKTNRKNKNKSIASPTIKTEVDPNAYATFESSLGNQEYLNQMVPPNIIKSHEGYVHTTNVEKNSNPQWNNSFNVQLPVDIMLNPQKRFVVKVWRKTTTEGLLMIPKPLEDAVIGFAAIDLSVLLTGLSVLSGWYNIVDFSGRCNGQIKMSFKPLEDVTQYQSELNSISSCPLDLDVDIEADGSTLLSRTLKRKFTELDEITQRLKARLFDVTGDENYDPDDEFEKDLNTEVDDMDDEHFKDEDFAWLGKGTGESNLFNEQANAFQTHLNSILNDQPQPSTSKSVQSHNSNGSGLNLHQRNVSGCSNPQPQKLSLDQLLKNYDLDTIINPNIFQNLLDPTLANSDSTPTLNPAPVAGDLINMSLDSDTTVSSNLSSSHDHVQTIQKALQRASIDEFGNNQDSRTGPEGKNKSPNE